MSFGSAPLVAFIRSSITLWEFAILAQSVHEFVDDLLEIDGPCASFDHLSSHLVDPAKLVINRDDHKLLLDELILTRAVETFDLYLTDVLRLLFERDPRLLRSNSTMRWDEILGHNTLDDLVTEIIGRRLDDLSYGGFLQISAYLERIGAEITIDDSTRLAVTEAIAVRNIVVHNGRRVNERFKKLTGQDGIRTGDLYAIDGEAVSSWMGAITTVARAIDASLIAKFALPTWPLPSTPDDENRS